MVYSIAQRLENLTTCESMTDSTDRVVDADQVISLLLMMV